MYATFETCALFNLSMYLDHCNIMGVAYYSNDPKFPDRQIWANGADPDQTAP